MLFLHFKNYFSIIEIEIHFRSTVQGDAEHNLFHVQGEVERTDILKIIAISKMSVLLASPCITAKTRYPLPNCVHISCSVFVNFQQTSTLINSSFIFKCSVGRCTIYDLPINTVGQKQLKMSHLFFYFINKGLCGVNVN